MDTTLSEDQRRRIFNLYGADHRDLFFLVRSWERILDHAQEVCEIIDRRLQWKGTIITRIFMSTNGASIHYLYLPLDAPSPEAASYKKGIASFKFDKITDIELWQFLLYHKYPVPLFISPRHPLNGSSALDIGIAVELH